ncbi:uncharacterized protein LOC133797857 isoform X2 [Humulus lupulus]|uniref:uncharacterized protein LOC133797857 isoform X2 n=1 Tax=Humulus lupulus TaxID=3486 RepID=UPI002B408865|nr:uncharacterized protein LOC133797857 isoform X2 [Humulus lupulus]
MHAVKGGWVGQTFALARSNESEGRKSRIRLSKKERKAMVESFIKKYQASNNGSFPSLNLTHKEVGGSFYTVREIVRDIIQENRVLGPAKLSGDGNGTDQLEEYPLGSIAIAPQYHLTQLSNGSQVMTNEYHGSNEEPNLVSDGHHAVLEDKVFDNGQVINVTIERGLSEPKDVETQGHEFMESEQNSDDQSSKEAGLVSDGNYACPGQEVVDNENVINGIPVGARHIESQEQNLSDLHASKPSEAENAEESAASRSKVTPIAADVIVETFPMRPAATTGEFDGRSNELTNVTHSFGRQDLIKVDLATDNGSSQTDRIESLKSFSLMDEEKVTNLSNDLGDKISGLVGAEELEKYRDPSLESSKSSNKGTGQEIHDLNGNEVKLSSTDVTTVTLEKSQAISGAKYIDNRGGTTEHLKTEQELNENEVDAQQGDKPQKGSSPTLDRINLESWGGRVSKNPGKPEGNNPMWAVFKAFIDAFVKFWSE